MLYMCFGDWQGRKLLVIGTTSLVRVLESMSLLDAFNVYLNVPKLKPADMKQVNFYWPQMLQVASADYFCSDWILMYLPIVICNSELPGSILVIHVRKLLGPLGST
jgi:hypothetical protein